MYILFYQTLNHSSSPTHFCYQKKKIQSSTWALFIYLLTTQSHVDVMFFTLVYFKWLFVEDRISIFFVFPNMENDVEDVSPTVLS